MTAINPGRWGRASPVSAQNRGIGDGWAATRKANRRPVYLTFQPIGHTAPEYILIGYTSDDDDV